MCLLPANLLQCQNSLCIHPGSGLLLYNMVMSVNVGFRLYALVRQHEPRVTDSGIRYIYIYIYIIYIYIYIYIKERVIDRERDRERDGERIIFLYV